MRYKCSNCITKELLKVNGRLFGSESDDENMNTDPKSDPMSESLPDKNKLSKSEKSLKMPL
jgi:hypothetical protein